MRIYKLLIYRLLILCLSCAPFLLNAQGYTVIKLTPPKCAGGSDGELQVKPKLSGPTVTFVLTGICTPNKPNQGSTGNIVTFKNLCSGNYNLTVNGTTGSITVPDVEPVEVGITHTVNLQGEITLTATPKGGTAPYTINWTDSEGGAYTGSTITSTVFGNFTCIVTDNSGGNCNATLTTNVNYEGYSYSDAPSYYGVVKQTLNKNLFLGLNKYENIQTAAVPSLLANTALNDNGFCDGVIPVDADGFTIINELLNNNCFIDENDNLIVKVKATNKTTSNFNLIAWIDFDQDRKFSSTEGVATIQAASGTQVVGQHIDGEFTFKWANASTKIKSGITYMRIRITTDNLSVDDATDNSLRDGEVEDYMLNFKLFELTKQAFTSNISDNFRANIGDKISYTITVTNKTKTLISNIKIFDPIPKYTDYVYSTANPATGLEGVVKINDIDNIPAIIWSNVSIAPEATQTFSFEVVVKDSPYGTDNDGYIPNVGFLKNNNDTINTATVNCFTADILVNHIFAGDDCVVLFKNDSIEYLNVGDNDSDPWRKYLMSNFVQPMPSDIQATFNSDGTINFKPNTNYVGDGSFDYELSSANGVDRARATVRYSVIDNFLQNYLACAGANVELSVGLAATNNKFDWYTESTGGTLIASDANKITVAVADKDTTVWLQVRLFIAPGAYCDASYRIPITINIDGNCGTITPDECSVSGTPLFRENFGGNTGAEAWISPNQLSAGKTNLIFNPTSPENNNNYVLVKRGEAWPALPSWITNIKDHTYPNTVDTGYFYLANIKTETDQYIYETTLTDLCDTSKLYFSAWLMNVAKKSQQSTSQPEVSFEVWSGAEKLGSFSTAVIGVDNEGEWKQYGFTYNVPVGVNNLTFRIKDRYKTGVNSGLAVDDIEIHFCVPKPTLPTLSDTAVCEGDNTFRLQGRYMDNGTLASVSNNKVDYRFEFKKKGSDTWVMYEEGTSVTAIPLMVTLSPFLGGIKNTNEGYYRLIVAKDGTMLGKPMDGNYNCKAISDSIYVKVVQSPAVPDVRVQICPSPGRTINLSSYVDNKSITSVEWLSSTSATVTADGKLQTSDLTQPDTYKFQYKAKNKCFDKTASLYLTVIKDETLNIPPDTVVVCRAIESSQHLLLNQIMGVEAMGIWVYDNTVNHDNEVTKYVTKLVAPSEYAGAYIFDASKAWEYVTDSRYVKPYNNDNNAKQFKFHYITKSADSSCLGDTIKEIVIIVTDRLFP